MFSYGNSLVVAGCYYFTFGCWCGRLAVLSVCLSVRLSVGVCVRLSVCLSVCLMMIELFHNIFYTVLARFQISLDSHHSIIMNTCIFDSFGRYVCVCVCFYVLKTIADVCSYIDWRKILREFKCLDQGHYLTL